MQESGARNEPVFSRAHEEPGRTLIRDEVRDTVADAAPPEGAGSD
ncbi:MULTISPECIES: hypothetical protein [Streptomyces]|nr:MULTISPECIES: hypothetical protein [unclassified Streptomyces]WPR51949.1 hypothetical protein SJI45_13800 [Streptomyces sp. S399]